MFAPLKPNLAWSLLGLVSLLGDPARVHAGQEVRHPSHAWKVGDSWAIRVERYPREAGAEIKQVPLPGGKAPGAAAPPFFMTIKVAAEEEVHGAVCLQLAFAPGKGAPADIEPLFRVFVRKHDGVPVKVLRGDQDLSAAFLETWAGTPFVTGTPDGFPLEILPFVELKSNAAESPLRSVAMHKRITGRNATLLEYTLRSKVHPQDRVVQIWPAGASWWEQYERYVKGRKDLVARLVPSAALASAPDTPLKPAPPVITADRPKPAPGSDPAGLQADPRLQVKLSATFRAPKAREILSWVQGATEVPLTAGEDVAATAPAFAGVNWHNVEAWAILQQLAASQVVAGRYERFEGGYRLIGSTPARAEDLDTPARSDSGPLLLVVLAVGLAILGVWLVSWFWRRRGKPDSEHGTTTAPRG